MGKSTSATNIAFGLVQLLRHIKAVNSRVLLIDTDSQGHASLVTLELSNEAIELADRHNLEESALHSVLALPADSQSEMLQQIIQFNLSGKQVKAIVDHADVDASVIPSTVVCPFAKSIAGIREIIA